MPHPARASVGAGPGAGQEWFLETSSDLSGLVPQWGHSGDPRGDQILSYIWKHVCCLFLTLEHCFTG